MTQNGMRLYVCKKIRLYDYLTDQGFIPVKRAHDIYNTDRLVWLYEDTQELRGAIDAYYGRISYGGKTGDVHG